MISPFNNIPPDIWKHIVSGVALVFVSVLNLLIMADKARKDGEAFDTLSKVITLCASIVMGLLCAWTVSAFSANEIVVRIATVAGALSGYEGIKLVRVYTGEMIGAFFTRLNKIVTGK